MVWRALNAEKDRMRESLEDVVLPAPNDCLSITLDLFIKTHVPTDLHDLFPPEKTIDNAMDLSSMLCDAGGATPYNMSHHHAALAAMVLVEALKKHDRKDGALVKLQQFNHALLSGAIVTPAGDRWITPLKNFLAASIQNHISGSTSNGVPSGPDRAGLQHLADAAVGETETVAESVGSRRGSGEYSTAAPKGYLTMLAKYV